MALIKCSECGKDVSDKAPACPNCGNPLSIQLVKIATPVGETLKVEPELTSKQWKTVKLVSWGVILVGATVAMTNGGSRDQLNLGLWIVILGIIALIVGKVGAWYTDKRTR